MLQTVITRPRAVCAGGAAPDALDGSFITPQAVPDYVDGAPLASRRGKVHPLGFPALLPRTTFSGGHDTVQCVFCGSLYPALREPGFALGCSARCTTAP